MQTDSGTGPTKNAHKLFVSGLVASGVYIGGMLLYSVHEWEHFLEMKPDEFATFLSGVFAPLAFLWLVLGFRQQGDELQNSARALWLQGEELRNSVEQQRQLVEVSREQLAAERDMREQEQGQLERDAQPRLVLATRGWSSSGSSRKYDFGVRNAGPPCSEVRVLVEGEARAASPVLLQGNGLDFSLHYEGVEEVKPVNIDIEYTDRIGIRRSQRFNVPIIGERLQDRAFGEAQRLSVLGVKAQAD